MFEKISLKIRYLISFILIFAVVVLLFVLLMTAYFNTQRNYTNSVTLEQFTFAAQNVDTLLSRIESSTVSADSLRAILGEEDAAASRWDRQIPAALANLEENMPKSGKVFLYLRGRKTIYTSSQELPYAEFERLLENSYSLNPSRFFSGVMTLRDKTIIPLLTSDGSRLTGLSYVLPLGGGKPLLDNAVLIYILSDSCITEEFENYLGTIRGDLYIYDNHYHCLYSHISGEAPMVPLEKLMKTKGVGLLPYADGLERLTVTNSENGLTCLMLIRSAELYREVLASQRSMMGLGALILLLISALFVCLTFFNYQPIGELMTDITGKKRIQANMNEIEIIRRSYRQTVEEAESFSSQLSEITPLMTQHFIQELTRGRLKDEQEIRRVASFAGLPMDKPYFGAMYIVPETSPHEDAELQLSQMLQISSRITATEGDLAFGELADENSVAVLANFSASQQEAAAHLERLAETVLEELDGQSLGRVKIDLGSVRTQASETPDAFAEADAAARLPDETEKRIIRYDSWKSNQCSSEERGTLPDVSLTLLTGAVRRGETELACRTLKEVTGQIGAATESMLFFRYYASEIVGKLIQTAEREQISLDSGDLRSLIEFKSRTEFEQNAAAFVGDLCSRVNQKQRQDSTDLSNRLMDYIMNHYKDYNLSIQSVAEALGLRKNRVSMILQDSVGMNFVQYVSTLRMNEFKRLLVESSLTINELINSVGYSDVPNFLRKFKAAEGMTAGNYRAVHSRWYEGERLEKNE